MVVSVVQELIMMSFVNFSSLIAQFKTGEEPGEKLQD
jgi:hypothetical protein